MRAPLTLSEALCIAILCLYAIGTARADPVPALPGPEKNYEQALARVETLYRAAQDVCEKAEGSKREVCLQAAKATHVRAIADAKARLKAAHTVSYHRRDPIGTWLERRL